MPSHLGEENAINIEYIYGNLVLGGLLEKILTAPLKESSLQGRVEKILRSISTLTEEDFPDDLKKSWRTLEAAREHKIDPRNAWITRILDETAACAKSLTRMEAQQVLQAYAHIVIEIAKRIGAARNGDA
jgi:hypothetical protein